MRVKNQQKQNQNRLQLKFTASLITSRISALTFILRSSKTKVHACVIIEKKMLTYIHCLNRKHCVKKKIKKSCASRRTRDNVNWTKETVVTYLYERCESCSSDERIYTLQFFANDACSLQRYQRQTFTRMTYLDQIRRRRKALRTCCISRTRELNVNTSRRLIAVEYIVNCSYALVKKAVAC